jgi:hypothetical protein
MTVSLWTHNSHRLQLSQSFRFKCPNQVLTVLVSDRDCLRCTTHLHHQLTPCTASVFLPNHCSWWWLFLLTHHHVLVLVLLRLFLVGIRLLSPFRCNRLQAFLALARLIVQNSCVRCDNIGYSLTLNGCGSFTPQASDGLILLDSLLKHQRLLHNAITSHRLLLGWYLTQVSPNFDGHFSGQ